MFLCSPVMTRLLFYTTGSISPLSLSSSSSATFFYSLTHNLISSSSWAVGARFGKEARIGVQRVLAAAAWCCGVGMGGVSCEKCDIIKLFFL